MRVGISTVQAAHNYGAMLQAYALRRYCENKGSDVILTDRRKEKSVIWNPKPFNALPWKQKLLYGKYLVKWYLPVYLPQKRRARKFESFLNTYLNDKPLLPNTEFDVIIYGSDQIWSKFNYGYDRAWWGYDGLIAKRRISYATSMGVVDIQKEDEPFIKEALAHYDAVSVREDDLYEELLTRRLIEKQDLHQSMDPTFLIPKEEWLKIASSRQIKGKYLLFYDFQLDETTTKIVQNIARERGLKIVRITDGLTPKDGSDVYLKAVGPAEFISLIYYADFVFSSSFHGVAFSIIFQKQFAVRQVWNTNRVKSLLRIANLSDRFIEGEERAKSIVDIQYDLLVNKLEETIQESQKYLEQYIQSK